jgi:hypothetical protein
MNSWNEKYVGTAAERLYGTIEAHCKTTSNNTYARYSAIVQSSGMGKSRMIDELSKNHLVIPINLRSESETGYNFHSHNFNKLNPLFRLPCCRQRRTRLSDWPSRRCNDTGTIV